MQNWFKPIADRNRPIPRRSEAWREGYAAYLSWDCTGGERPDNPYWTGSTEGESYNYEQWQQGWDDAAWDS
jgi:hypothetical protein